MILDVAPATRRFDDKACLEYVVVAGNQSINRNAYRFVERSKNLVQNAVDIR